MDFTIRVYLNRSFFQATVDLGGRLCPGRLPFLHLYPAGFLFLNGATEFLGTKGSKNQGDAMHQVRAKDFCPILQTRDKEDYYYQLDGGVGLSKIKFKRI